MADVQETLDLRRRARRRLIGAIALVLALVIVPPWIMDLEPKPVATKLSVEIPSQDASRLKPPAKPPVADPAKAPGAAKSPDVAKAPEPGKAPEVAKSADAAQASKGGEPATAPSARPADAAKAKAPTANSSLDAQTVAALGAPKTAEPAAAKPTEDAARPAAKPVDTPVKAPEPAVKPSEAVKKSADTARAEAAVSGAAEAFVIPLGSFGNADNVKQLQARLTKEGIQSYTEPVKTASGEQTRVRAGPYPSREAAEKARERVKGLGIDAGNVIARQ
jgi:DedD protein